MKITPRSKYDDASPLDNLLNIGRYRRNYPSDTKVVLKEKIKELFSNLAIDTISGDTDLERLIMKIEEL